MRVRHLLISGAVLMSAATASAADAAPSVYTGEFEVRPAVIGAWTGDGTGFLGGSEGRPSEHDFGHVRWSSWTSKGARGRGVVWANDCDPSCADGRFGSDGPTSIVLSRPRNGHFTRMRFSMKIGAHRKRTSWRYANQSQGWLFVP